MDRLTYRVAEFAEAISVSRSKVYALVASGDVPSVRIGGSLRIPVDAARQWLRQKLEQQTGTTAA